MDIVLKEIRVSVISLKTDQDELKFLYMKSTERAPLLGSKSCLSHRSLLEAGVLRDTGKESGFYDDTEGSNESLTTRAYPSRFWICGIFSALTFLHAIVWNTWGPISESVDAAFPNFDSSTVAMLTNWGTIMYVLFFIPMIWLTQKTGLRCVVLACALCMALGAGLRCITEEASIFLPLCHVCAILTGIASTLLLAGPSLIAADWFPPNERATAVGFMMGAANLGGVGAYLEPLLVRSPGPDIDEEDIRKDIMKLLYIICGSVVFLLVCIAVYFPSKPPSEPSISSITDRLPFSQALMACLKNRQFMYIMLIYGLVVGPPIAWIPMIDYSLLPLGFSQTDTMWVALVTIIVSSIASLLTGRLTDLASGYLRSSIIVLLLTSSICFYWFLLISHGILEPYKWQIYLSIIGGCSSSYGAITLFFEMGNELTYPVPEIMMSGILTAADNFSSFIFLLGYMYPGIGYQWVTYVLVGCSGLMIIPMILIKIDYTRAKVDNNQT